MAIEKITINIELDEINLAVGELVQLNKNFYFKYTADFIDSGLEISPFKMKLSSDILHADLHPFEGLFGVFNDSLPDGWGKLLLDRKLLSKGKSLGDITLLDRLAFVGKNGMGALVYEPEIELKTTLQEELDLESIYSETLKIVADTTIENIDLLFEMGGSSGGARPKVFIGYNPITHTIIQDKTILPENFEHWIVKFPSSSDIPEIAKIEYSYYLLALECGIEMSTSHLFKGKSGNHFFATKRFDRVENRRLHLHSAAGIMHDNFRMSSMDYGHLMDCAFKLEKHHHAYEKVFRLAVFNVIMHNRDDHSKNFSFLMNAKGEWKLAPAYDLTFSNSAHGHHSTMIMGESKQPTSKNLMKLAQYFGLKNGRAILDEVAESTKKWESLAKELELSTSTINMISNKINSFR